MCFMVRRPLFNTRRETNALPPLLSFYPKFYVSSAKTEAAPVSSAKTKAAVPVALLMAVAIMMFSAFGLTFSVNGKAPPA
jgi:hypothetical protein